jgi:hypothetical protein
MKNTKEKSAVEVGASATETTINTTESINEISGNVKDSLEEKRNFIRKKLGVRDALVQLGEECSELSAIVFKLIRKIDDNNPTPLYFNEIMEKVDEEITDVMLCLDIMHEVFGDMELYRRKLNRWVKRLEEKENGKHD